MSLIMDWWNYFLAGLAVVAALASAYIGGKKSAQHKHRRKLM